MTDWNRSVGLLGIRFDPQFARLVAIRVSRLDQPNTATEDIRFESLPASVDAICFWSQPVIDRLVHVTDLGSSQLDWLQSVSGLETSCLLSAFDSERPSGSEFVNQKEVLNSSLIAFLSSR